MRTALLLFAAFFALYASRAWYDRPQVVLDNFGTKHVPASLLRQGNTDLDEFVPLSGGDSVPYHVTRVNGRLYSRYPLGPGLLLLPAYAAAAALGYDVVNHAPSRDHFCCLTAAALSALACALLYLALLPRGRGRALLAAVALGLGSSVWPLCATELWQHTFGIVFVAWAVYLVERPGGDRWLGLPCGLLMFIRPTNAVLVAVVAVWVGWRSRRNLPRFVLLAAPFAAVVLGYNLWMFGQPSGGYAAEAGALRLSNLWGGSLSGTLFSPSRGLLVYSPWVIVGLIGWRSAPVYAALLAAQVGLFGTYSCWYGGYCYGPRLLLEAMPAAAALLAVAWPERFAARLVASALVAWSIFAAGCGSFISWDQWCQQPDIDSCPARLWDWRDSPIAAACFGLPTGCTHGPALRSDTCRLYGVGIGLGAGWANGEVPPVALGCEARVRLRFNGVPVGAVVLELRGEVPQEVRAELGGAVVTGRLSADDVTALRVPVSEAARAAGEAWLTLHFTSWRFRAWNDIRPIAAHLVDLKLVAIDSPPRRGL
jgi:hypothetical protein